MKQKKTVTDYISKLSSMLVEVYFAVIYHQIKGYNKSIFNAILYEIIVLYPPITTIHTPIKYKIYFGPSTIKKAKQQDTD